MPSLMLVSMTEFSLEKDFHRKKTEVKIGYYKHGKRCLNFVTRRMYVFKFFNEVFVF